MALVIEDGTIVAGANSYATVADARAYASARGLTLSDDDAVVEAALVNAADLLERYDFKGSRVDAAQELAWPREDVFVFDNDDALAEDEIPALLIKVQCQLAYDATQTELQPTGTGQEVVSEKVDVLEVKYAEKGSGSITPEFNKAEEMLAPLLNTGGAISLVSKRL